MVVARALLLIAVLTVVFGACQSLKKLPPRVASDSEIDQVYAEQRFKLIANPRYDIDIELSDDDPVFIGTTTLTFDLKSDSPLTVDFQKGEIQKVVINGVENLSYQYNQSYLQFAAGSFRPGNNTLVITYSHPYSRDGAGLYRFKDSEDGRTYVYTDFEPYYASRLFPCFDQPDLKATYRLKVRAPGDWQVITSVLEDKVTRDKGLATWQFPWSEKFSTYLISLHAGPYQVWSSTAVVNKLESKTQKTTGAQTVAQTIPLRLFARQSMAKYVQHKELLAWTQQGFQFFVDYFGELYPYKKYDQVIVPDFNSGAMENVAAVTFTEKYFSRGQMTRAEMRDLNNTLLHEMAHMWFGNLVTMKWWDDLWLNESFATYMAYVAANEASEFSESWLEFFTGTKQWAYWEDQNVTTHPVVGKVANTTEASSIFDGITYGKGASTLKQLAYFLGPEKFRAGVRLYFDRHAQSNTRLSDFMQALSDASGVDLKSWTEKWLRKESLNTVEAVFQCKEDRIASFKLRQTAPREHSTLRSHRLQVGLFAMENKIDNKTATKTQAMTLGKAISVTLEDEETAVPEALGLPCPELVHPNYADHGFFKSKIDGQSLERLSTVLTRIEDPLVRGMFWYSLWDMVVDGEFSLRDYVEIFAKHIEQENDLLVLSRVLQTIYQGAQSVVSYLPTQGEQALNWRQQTEARLEQLLWRSMLRASSQDEKKLWYEAYQAIAVSPAAQAQLLKVAQGEKKIQGLESDQDLRWSAITRLNSLGHVQGENLVVRASREDRSDWAKKYALSARAARPDRALKWRLLSEVEKESSAYSLSEVRAVISTVFPRQQERFRREYLPEFYQKLPAFTPVRDLLFVENFARFLAPVTCSAEENQRLTQFLAEQKKLPDGVRKRLRIAHQEDQRCMTVRAKAFGVEKGGAL